MDKVEIKLHNTLTDKKEVFAPIIKGRVSMYNCGPTVYDRAHIGNLRAYVFADTLRRMFEYFGYSVDQIINITDVGHLSGENEGNADQGEDKMTKALKREGKTLNRDNMYEVATKYLNIFKEDIRELNIKEAKEYPRAADHIQEDIDIIQILENKGFTYKTSDGIYFDTSKYKDYGRLGNIDVEKLKAGARVTINSEKKNTTDFALWKFNESLGWSSPWGNGFPGWHIECSAMSRKYLGQPFDIHTGGIDHISIHHNNEIAQSECAFDKPLANFWLHNGFLNIKGGKMAKSAGGTLHLGSLEEDGIFPIAYRYWLLTAHYHVPINFSKEAVLASQNAFVKLISTLSKFPSGGKVNADYKEKFGEAIANDLDTPNALALVWTLLKDEKVGDADKLATIMDFDQVFGLDLLHNIANMNIEDNEVDISIISPEIKTMLEEREKARLAKDWQKADMIRENIKKFGYEVVDVDGKVVLRKL
jgi:cysteinyl-tRNA synthetase